MIWLQVLGAVAVLLGAFVIRASTRRRPLLGYRGPKGWPIIGNMAVFAQPKLWEVFSAYSQQFGDVFKLTAGSQDFVVINSEAASRRYLGNFGNQFSDRFPMLTPEVLDALHYKRWWTVLFDHGHDLGVSRKHLLTMTRIQSSSGRYQLGLSAECKAFGEYLKSCDHRPDELYKFLRASLSVKSANQIFGSELPFPRNAKEVDDAGQLRTRMDSIMDQVTKLAAAPIPLLFPWSKSLMKTSIAKDAAIAQQLYQQQHAMLWELAAKFLKQYRAGEISGNDNNSPSLIGVVWERMTNSAVKTHSFDESVALDLIGTMMWGGYTNTASLIHSCLAAISTLPDLYKELMDTVAAAVEAEGDLRPCKHEHFNTPQMVAFVKEVNRLYSPGPNGAIPRRATEDVQLDGRLVPKGTAVWINAWAINRDPLHYSDPLAFRPGRFLENESLLDSPFTLATSNKPRDHVSYGFGNRTCPGTDLAEQYALSTVTSLLWNFQPVSLEDASVDAAHLPGSVAGVGFSVEHRMKFVPQNRGKEGLGAI